MLKVPKARNGKDRLVFIDPVTPNYCLVPWALFSPQNKEALQCFLYVAVNKWVICYSKCLTGNHARLSQIRNVCLLEVQFRILVYNQSIVNIMIIINKTLQSLNMQTHTSCPVPKDNFPLLHAWEKGVGREGGRGKIFSVLVLLIEESFFCNSIGISSWFVNHIKW